MSLVPSLGTLAKLTITAFSDETYQTPLSPAFTAVINPSSYRNGFNIDYVTRKEIGGKSESPSFKRIGKEDLSFELILDGTGVIPMPTQYEGWNVDQLLAQLKATVYNYEGEIHQPYFVQITWGTNLSFNGRLSNMSVDYKMFSPAGATLRASVSLSFTQYKSIDLAQAEGNDQSPDMTHIITIMPGDTLPRLCEKIYGKSEYYLQVARLNKLSNFRNLEAGSQLFFPPLK
ncbi:MAG: CIS tube protein [Flavobacteriales bacterium]